MSFMCFSLTNKLTLRSNLAVPSFILHIYPPLPLLLHIILSETRSPLHFSSSPPIRGLDMSKAHCLVWLFCVSALVFSTTLWTQVSCEKKSMTRSGLDDDQKSSYYTPKNPPSGGHSSSSHGSSSNCPTPSHGSSSHSTPTPVYHSPPSHGGSGSHTPKYGGTPPSHGGYGSPRPTHGGRSSSHSSSSTPQFGGSSPPPSVLTPAFPTPHDSPPLIPTPILTPPSLPNFPSITGTCDFWRTHPSLLWGICGYLGSMGNIFGMPFTSIFGGSPTIPQALASTRSDGYGALLREGTASLLNSMANHKFPFTTQQVKESFTAALTSEKTAAVQAERFRLANEGKKP